MQGLTVKVVRPHAADCYHARPRRGLAAWVLRDEWVYLARDGTRRGAGCRWQRLGCEFGRCGAEALVLVSSVELAVTAAVEDEARERLVQRHLALARHVRSEPGKVVLRCSRRGGHADPEGETFHDRRSRGEVGLAIEAAAVGWRVDGRGRPVCPLHEGAAGGR